MTNVKLTMELIDQVHHDLRKSCSLLADVSYLLKGDGDYEATVRVMYDDIRHMRVQLDDIYTELSTR